MNRIYSKGDIVLTNMGDNTERTEKSGIRPCVIVSNNMMNENSANLVIVPITRAEHKLIEGSEDRYYLLPTQLIIEPDESNKLHHKSIAQIEDIRSISKKRIVKKIGELSSDDIIKLDKKFPRLFFI